MQAVIERERRGDYLGKTVQVVPHITDAIQDWIQRVAALPVDGRPGSAPQRSECFLLNAKPWSLCPNAQALGRSWYWGQAAMAVAAVTCTALSCMRHSCSPPSAQAHRHARRRCGVACTALSCMRHSCSTPSA